MPIPSRTRSLREPKVHVVADSNHRRLQSALELPSEPAHDLRSIRPQSLVQAQPSRIAQPKPQSSHIPSILSTNAVKRRSLLPQKFSNAGLSSLASHSPTDPSPGADLRSPTRKLRAPTSFPKIEKKTTNDNGGDTSDSQHASAISSGLKKSVNLHNGVSKRLSLRRPLSLYQPRPSERTAGNDKPTISRASNHGSVDDGSNGPSSDRESHIPELASRGDSPASTVSSVSRLSFDRDHASKLKPMNENALRGDLQKKMSRHQSLLLPSSSRLKGAKELHNRQSTNTAPHDGPRQMKRPAFSTYQQRFTPKKTEKPATSAFLHPPAPPSKSTLSPAQMRQQAELLQLHLLHREALQIQETWEQSATRHFENTFKAVVESDGKVRDAELQGTELRNLQVLYDWNGGSMDYQTTERIQRLARVIQELSGLIYGSGRYTLFACQFEDWYAWVQSCFDTRKTVGLSATTATPALVESLGDAWRGEAIALDRKLTACLRDLDNLQARDDNGILSRVLVDHKDMAATLLSEIKVMQEIEKDIVNRDRRWLEARVLGDAAKADDIDSDDRLEDTAASSPAWHLT